MLDSCPRCGCDSLSYHDRIRAKHLYYPNPLQRCECDIHPQCGWDEPTERKRSKVEAR